MVIFALRSLIVFLVVKIIQKKQLGNFFMFKQKTTWIGIGVILSGIGTIFGFDIPSSIGELLAGIGVILAGKK